MKLERPATRSGLTLLETLLVIFSLSLLLMMLLPALAATRFKKGKIDCTRNLMQIGMSFRVWEGEHHGKYPYGISITNGGTMEAIARGNLISTFQILSNELASPGILACPADKFRHGATNFISLKSRNISYFVNIDVAEAHPRGVLLGDDNLIINGTRAKSGLMVISSNTPLAWTPDRHGRTCNIVLADGSVESMSHPGLTNWQRSASFTPMRLAIP